MASSALIGAALGVGYTVTVTAANLPKFNWRLRVASGLVSFGFGAVLIYGIGFAEGGLFTDAPIWEPH